MLYVIATPIGNLNDISYRAVEQLRDASLIVAENPNHSRKLLQHFNITGKKIFQFADHNESTALPGIIKLLQEQDGCLISDAGTPAISDPGFRLVRACWENGIQVSPIPGPSAVISLLSAAGLPTDKFLFVGFLPKTEPKLQQIVEQAKFAKATLVAYESPQRIVKTLTWLAKTNPTTQVGLGRELTKIHEEILRGSCAEILEQISSRQSIKGEITLIISFK